MNVLEMNNIKKSFGSKVVLEDITLKIEEGEVVSIIGPSGSGKSTLLRCATFLEHIDNGEIFYINKQVVKKVLMGLFIHIRKNYSRHVLTLDL